MGHKLKIYGVESSELEYYNYFLHAELQRKLDSKIQLHRSVTNGIEGYFNMQ